jgi:hypothetical protein
VKSTAGCDGGAIKANLLDEHVTGAVQDAPESCGYNKRYGTAETSVRCTYPARPTKTAKRLQLSVITTWFRVHLI